VEHTKKSRFSINYLGTIGLETVYLVLSYIDQMKVFKRSDWHAMMGYARGSTLAGMEGGRDLERGSECP
jgi:hypothetical protein